MSRKKRNKPTDPEEIPVHFDDDQASSPEPGDADAAHPDESDMPDMPDADESSHQDPPSQPSADPAGEDYQGKYLRLLAEFQNYKKRSAKEAQQSTAFANERLIKDLLTVIDDMERALAAARDNHGEDDPLFKGMQMVHDNMLGVLQRYGLTPIDATGETFDPEKHSAMMQEPSDQPPMTVLRQLQRGYELKGRTIRPAAVVVASAEE